MSDLLLRVAFQTFWLLPALTSSPPSSCSFPLHLQLPSSLLLLVTFLIFFSIVLLTCTVTAYYVTVFAIGFHAIVHMHHRERGRGEREIGITGKTIVAGVSTGVAGKGTYEGVGAGTGLEMTLASKGGTGSVSSTMGGKTSTKVNRDSGLALGIPGTSWV
ncbi:hypothetical protein CPB84DRAFT_1753125 [Gymnopilus junonius]|uniref:Uncharacterized protein n=1 Tax=Gymnopilus junonius TaxID=109634 RepID=A0A9P5N9K2_GYMJU|nr:hypothetical protein CPB84DRAFT_1753125 [Gymnopilus junonius]